MSKTATDTVKPHGIFSGVRVDQLPIFSPGEAQEAGVKMKAPSFMLCLALAALPASAFVPSSARAASATRGKPLTVSAAVLQRVTWKMGRELAQSLLGARALSPRC